MNERAMSLLWTPVCGARPYVVAATMRWIAPASRRLKEALKTIAGVWLVMVLVPICLFEAAWGQDFESIKSSVVKVVSERDGLRRTGTGFVVKVEGEDVYIATASHVIEGDGQPRVYFLARRNAPATARVVKLEGGDPRGMGLLLVQGAAEVPRGLVALPLALDDTLAGGDELTIIGFGQGQGEWAVIRASVTSIDGRDIRLEGRIEEGNSGGPLLKQGKVVGLITGLRQGFGIASPGYVVAGTLRGWKVDLGTDDRPENTGRTGVPVRADRNAAEVAPAQAGHSDGVMLRAASIRAGHITQEQSEFEMRDAVLTVALAGQQLRGSAKLVQRQKLEREILAVEQGRSSQERLHFVELSGSITRELDGDSETQDRAGPMRGKTIIATRQGSTWRFGPDAGALSAAQQRELLSYFASGDDGFPATALRPGENWEVSGPALNNFLQLGDFAATEGKASLRLERVGVCARAQCAEISFHIVLAGVMVDAEGVQTYVGLEGNGRLLREVGTAMNREVQITGQMSMAGMTAVGGVPVQLAIVGPFVYRADVHD